MDSLPDINTTGITSKFLDATSLDSGGCTLLVSDRSTTWRSCVDDGKVESVSFDGHSDHLSQISTMVISRDGELVATADSDKSVIIWQVKSGKALYGPLNGHTGTIFTLSFSVDNKMVASGGSDNNIWVWSTDTGQAIHGPMECHEDSVVGLCFKLVAVHFKI
jgi:WD40 repeat protein